MRKLWFAAVAAVVVAFSAVGIAYAVNTYEVDIASGGPGNKAGSAAKPMSAADIEDKFRNNAGLVLPEDRVEEIVKAIRDLETR